MRMVYKVLAFAIAALVVVQAATIAFAIFGLTTWIQQGGSLDASSMENDVTFTGVAGFMIHGIFGMMVIPVIALLLLVSSFFARTPKAVLWALIVVVTTAVQVGLGVFAHGIPQLGILHGAVALVLFGAAIMAGLRAAKPAPSNQSVSTEAAAPIVTA